MTEQEARAFIHNKAAMRRLALGAGRAAEEFERVWAQLDAIRRACIADVVRMRLRQIAQATRCM